MDVITDDGKLLDTKETQVRADGTTATDSIHAPVDGKFHPIGASQDRGRVAVTKRVGDSMRLELVAPNGMRGIETCKISSDLNTLTCDIAITAPGGKKASARSVYVRDNS